MKHEVNRYTNRRLWAVLIAGAVLAGAPAQGQESADEALRIPAISDFLPDGEFGNRNPRAPVDLEHFGQLSGVWSAEQEMRSADGSWRVVGEALWVWRWGLSGFVVRDLWFQAEKKLPAYLGNLGRDYLLTGLRTFDVETDSWNVAWTANGMGQTPGNDFGTMVAEWQGDRMVMTSPPDYFGVQRVTFSDFTDNSFLWVSEFSSDEGQNWQAVMRVRASRLQ